MKTTSDINAPASPELFGLILAGGQSSRMGQDKALIRYHGEPQARHCHRLLSNFCKRVFLSCRAEQWAKPEFQTELQDLPVILDTQPEIGPMAGLLSAMEAHSNTAWFLLACDMPGVNAACVATLVKHRNPSRIATAFYTRDTTNHPRFEPLFTIYEPDCLPYIQQQLKSGKTGLRPLLDSFLTQGRIQGLNLADFAPELGLALQSLNTPEAARNWAPP